MIGVRALIGGTRSGVREEQRFPLAHATAQERVSARLAELRRLEDDLERARLRYERAIAGYERRTGELEGGDAPRASGNGNGTGKRVTSGNGDGARLRFSTATFDDLQALGLSQTQSKRVLRHRSDGDVDSVAGLDRVPGIPRATLTELQQHLRD